MSSKRVLLQTWCPTFRARLIAVILLLVCGITLGFLIGQWVSDKGIYLVG